MGAHFKLSTSTDLNDFHRIVIYTDGSSHALIDIALLFGMPSKAEPTLGRLWCLENVLLIHTPLLKLLAGAHKRFITSLTVLTILVQNIWGPIWERGKPSHGLACGG